MAWNQDIQFPFQKLWILVVVMHMFRRVAQVTQLLHLSDHAPVNGPPLLDALVGKQVRPDVTLAFRIQVIQSMGPQGVPHGLSI
jgi:hypothetical protein